MNTCEPVLKIDGLKAGYGKIQVLWDVSLTIHAGEIVALVGSNGAGKTTLLKSISGMIPSNGSIKLCCHEINGLSPEQIFSLGLVQVPEGRMLFPLMTVEENLIMGGYFHEKKIISVNLEKVYAFFPVLKERRKQAAGSLSGGEQQMCAIARALMAMPKLLMVDEMSLGLAPVIIDVLFEAISLIRQEGVTILLVEQDVYSAFQMADRGYIMENGKIVREGVASKLIADPEIQKAYFGV